MFCFCFALVGTHAARARRGAASPGIFGALTNYRNLLLRREALLKSILNPYTNAFSFRPFSFSPFFAFLNRARAKGRGGKVPIRLLAPLWNLMSSSLIHYSTRTDDRPKPRRTMPALDRKIDKRSPSLSSPPPCRFAAGIAVRLRTLSCPIRPNWHGGRMTPCCWRHLPGALHVERVFLSNPRRLGGIDGPLPHWRRTRLERCDWPGNLAKRRRSDPR